MQAVFSERARLQRMLDFAVALVRAQAAIGMLPALAIDPIANAARAEHFDLDALGKAALETGSTAEPLMKALTEHVAKTDSKAAGYVNWGASSQDIVDTALALDLKAAIDVLIADLGRAIDGFITLAGRHRRTLTVARVRLQHGLPVPLGLKLAGYAAALSRSRDRLRRLRREALALQFGGSVGTLAALKDRGLEVADRLAALLDLAAPELPWHTHRDRLAEVAAAFAILAGTCGKVARDLALLMQTEVGEAFKAAKPDNGSPMPHQRDPRSASVALAAATMAPHLAGTILAAQAQEHEGALGGWDAERAAFPALALVASGATHSVAEIAESLEIDAERARSNLELTHGIIMAEAISTELADKAGKDEARRMVENAIARAVSTKRDLQDVLIEDERVKKYLTVGELARLFEPMTYQGVAQTFFDRIVGQLQGRATKR
jgi:3-carboxy-cis,cis-muconate cycloisomerase